MRRAVSIPAVAVVLAAAIAGAWWLGFGSSRPAWMAHGPADCHTAIDLDDPRGSDTYDPLGPGQPLAGTGIERLTPAEAHNLLNREGICHNFRWMYWIDIDAGLVAAEVWCQPPPGVIDSIAYQTDATVVVFVQGETPATPPPVRNDAVGC